MKKEISNNGTWIIEFDTNNEKFYLHQLNEPFNENTKEQYGTYDTYNKAEQAIKESPKLPTKEEQRYTTRKYLHPPCEPYPNSHT